MKRYCPHCIKMQQSAKIVTTTHTVWTCILCSKPVYITKKSTKLPRPRKTDPSSKNVEERFVWFEHEQFFDLPRVEEIEIEYEMEFRDFKMGPERRWSLGYLAELKQLLNWRLEDA